MTTTIPANRTELHALLMAHAEDVVDAVIDALAAAGSQPEWDSETIEIVLGRIEDVTREQLGVPGCGSSGPGGSWTEFWQMIEDEDGE